MYEGKMQGKMPNTRYQFSCGGNFSPNVWNILIFEQVTYIFVNLSIYILSANIVWPILNDHSVQLAELSKMANISWINMDIYKTINVVLYIW